MKSETMARKGLGLRKETLRRLTPEELSRAAGGAKQTITSECSTEVTVCNNSCITQNYACW